MSGKVFPLRVQTDRLERERKILMGLLNVGVIFIVGRGLVLTVRVETPHVKRRMSTHPTRHLVRACFALSEQHTKGVDVLGQKFNAAHISHYVSR